MNERERELFNDSLERCTQRSDFIDRFYEKFLSSSEEVREKFKNTDFKRQRRMLHSSLYLLVFASEGREEGVLHLDRIAKLHSRHQLDIQPHLYNLWAECLLATVKDCDPRFSEDVGQAWRSMIRIGVDHLVKRYQQS